jgi:hypothetical protein
MGIHKMEASKMISLWLRIAESPPFRGILKRVMRKINASGKYSITALDPLTQIANKNGTDKGNLGSSAHYYTRVYRSLFDALRDRNVVVLEIGLMRTELDSRRRTPAHEGRSGAKAIKAPSLAMWREYFRNADIYGFDVDDFSQVKIANCNIIQGDMSSADDLKRLVDFIGRPIDIVIDDASHVSHHQQIAFGNLFPVVAPGGTYVIEDLGWQDPNFEHSNAAKTGDLLRTFAVTGEFNSPYISHQQRQFIEANVQSVRLFDSMCSDIKQGHGALGVIVKS